MTVDLEEKLLASTSAGDMVRSSSDNTFAKMILRPCVAARICRSDKGEGRTDHFVSGRHIECYICQMECGRTAGNGYCMPNGHFCGKSVLKGFGRRTHGKPFRFQYFCDRRNFFRTDVRGSKRYFPVHESGINDQIA